MIKSLTNLGHLVSAATGSILYGRSKSAARIRVIATGALLTGTFLVSFSEIASAATGGQSLKDYSAQVSDKTNVVVDIVSYICYLGGAGLSALGIVDLKKHVEQPTQTPLKNGVAKLAFGGILLALPFVSGVMAETMTGQQQANYQGFNRSSMQIR